MKADIIAPSTERVKTANQMHNVSHGCSGFLTPKPSSRSVIPFGRVCSTEVDISGFPFHRTRKVVNDRDRDDGLNWKLWAPPA